MTTTTAPIDWTLSQRGAELFALEYLATGSVEMARRTLEQRARYRDEQLIPSELIASVSR